MIADFEDVTQDARSSLVISSECFSVLARWRGHCYRRWSRVVSRWEGILARFCEVRAEKRWFLNKSRVLVLPRAPSGTEDTIPSIRSSSAFALTLIMAVWEQRLPRSVHPFKWAVLGSGSHSLGESKWFLWDRSPVHPIMKRLLLSYWNIKAHAAWNRLKLMKVIRSFVTDGWQETVERWPPFSPRRSVAMREDVFI